MSVCTLSDYRRITRDRQNYDGDVVGALASAQTDIEGLCDRHFDLATRTETMVVPVSGVLVPSAWPIVSVTDPSQALIRGSAIFIGYRHGWPVVNINPDFYPYFPDPSITVTYIGGYASGAAPEELKRIVCKMAAQALLSQVEDLAMAGVRSRSTGDISVTGSPRTFADLDQATRVTLLKYRRRVL